MSRSRARLRWAASRLGLTNGGSEDNAIAVVHRALETYHSSPRSVLWRCVDHLFERFDAEFIAGFEPGAGCQSCASLASSAGEHPCAGAPGCAASELNRIIWCTRRFGGLLSA